MDQLFAERDSLAAQADSLLATQPDSLNTVFTGTGTSTALPPPKPWYDPLIPTLDGRIESNVTRVVSSVGLEAPVGGFFNMNGRARYSRTDTEYRQFDRDAVATNFNLDFDGSIPSWGELDISVLRNTSLDENRLPPRPPTNESELLVLEFELREVHASLVGNRDLGRGLRAHWGVRGDIEDTERTDKGIANDRALAGGAADVAWGSEGPWHDFSTRYGYDRRSGERTLRNELADALTERDTIWARGRVDFGERFSLNMDGQRTTFVEERLDFTRNVNGVVDTLGVLNPVAEERESTVRNSWNADMLTRPLPRLSLSAGAQQSVSESSYTLSREGLVQLRNEGLDAGGVLRYAMAGSLRVRYVFLDRANDRRARGSEDFRGEESRQSRRADAQFRHRLARGIDMHLDLQQTLDQTINEDPDNKNDRDRLVTRTDLRLLADPWEWFDVEAAGAYSREQEINIDADRVLNNQDSDLFEVRGSFTLDPEGGWRFVQNYRMQIRIIDRVAGPEGDKFNKQGQWDNRAEYRFSNGIFADGQYIVDYRRNGDRDTSRPDEEVYIYRGARRDHRVVFGVRVPIAGAELEVRTERGFLRDESGLFPRNEDRGKFSAGLKGNWQFWRNRASLQVNATRILQFGPRVRDEQRDYWVMNTSLRVAF